MSSKDNLPQLPVNEQRVGDQLRQRREGQSLSLAEVAENTRISLSNLKAIEASAYGELPADSFTKGLIALYAEALGLDGRTMADRFFFERDGGKKSLLTPLQKSMSTHPLTPKILAESPHVSSAAIAGVLLIFIVLSFGGFCLYFSWNPFAVLTDKALSLSTSVTGSFHPADPATNTGKPQNNLSVQAQFLKDTRVLLSVDNTPPVEQSYTKGTSVHWEADKQLQVEFFLPDAAELQLNGEPLGFPSEADGRYLLRVPAGATGQ